MHPAGGVHCGPREGNGKEKMGSDHGHNRVSTYAKIMITIAYQRAMIMDLCHCSQRVRASVNVWLCWLVYWCRPISSSSSYANYPVRNQPQSDLAPISGFESSKTVKNYTPYVQPLGEYDISE